MFSPIALFVYKRLWHTQQVIQALSRNDFANESDLIIFSDGARNENDNREVEKVRNFIHSITGFKSVQIKESPRNRGLANSIIEGVKNTLKEYESVIVLEDDLVTSPYFLSYMNQALKLYENDEMVISIHGYAYPLKGETPQTFFIKGADCWGWATWKRGWALFERDGSKLLDEIKARGVSTEFDFDKAFPFTKMLADQIAGLNDSWAIRWQASAFLSDRLTFYPATTFVQNIGFDDNGTNTTGSGSIFYSPLRTTKCRVEKIPIMEDLTMRKRMALFLKRTRNTIIQRVIRKLKSLVNSDLAI